MKSREQVADELESEDSDSSDSGDATVRNCDQIESLDEDSE
jgi:hypothetical protein